MKAKVSIAYLQAPVTLTSLGLVAVTQLGGGKTPGITVTTNDAGLVVQKDNLFAIVPWTNVKIASFEYVELATVKK